MDSTGAAYFPNLFSLLLLAAAVTAALVAAGMYWRRHRPTIASPAPRSAPGKITYRDAPTVRIVDSQRVDRRRKRVRLAPGEFVDVVETRAGLPPRFRITLQRIVECEGGAVAQIAVEFSETMVSCGPLVEETGFNQFVLARAGRDEPRNSVFHYQESGDILDFMRIKLHAVEAAANWAEIDVLQVSGRWSAG